jgi:hypothetical protein
VESENVVVLNWILGRWNTLIFLGYLSEFLGNFYYFCYDKKWSTDMFVYQKIRKYLVLSFQKSIFLQDIFEAGFTL